MGTNEVRCYGCGKTYRPDLADERARHAGHGGDTGLPREWLLRMLDEAQAERDAYAARLLDPPRSRSTGEDDALHRLALLEAQRRAALDELARIHAQRCDVVRDMRKRLTPTQIGQLLGISRQAVHKLLGPVATESCPDDA